MYIVTFKDAGLCYLTEAFPLSGWCAYRLTTNRKIRTLFSTKQKAKRALKEMYQYREGRKLKTPIDQLRFWKIEEEKDGQK